MTGKATGLTPTAWHRMFLALLYFCLTGIAGTGAVALAQGTASTAAALSATADAVRFGSVWRIRGDVSATVVDTGRTRKLQEGEAVFVGERVRAETSAEAVLKTDDAGLLAVRPGASFVAERFSAEGKPEDAFTLRVVSGALRLITGWIGRSNRAQYRVVTPSATIGIRGTDHEPYVITPDLATTLAQPAGTYNKVNSGGTTLEVGSNRIEIDAGRAGFVRAAGSTTTRALMTLVLPVLLDRVPAFYVPGEFDAELDQLSVLAGENALRQLEQRRTTVPQTSAPAASAAPAPAAAPATAVASGTPAMPGASAASTERTAAGATCGAQEIARSWLAQLDAAISRRNAAAIGRLFAATTVVQATVRDTSGARTTIDIGRDEFVQSTVAALRRLTDYRQRRPVIDGRPAQVDTCNRIAVRSVVIEQGKQNGQPYRFESVEDYLLERQSGRWLAVQATTTQQ